jgi:hypothetical protein
VTEPPGAGAALAVAGALTWQAASANVHIAPHPSERNRRRTRSGGYLLWMSNQTLATELTRNAAASTQVV